MAKMQSPTATSDKSIQALLTRYECPTPWPAVRTVLMGSIASPQLGASPLAAVESLWNGALPEFESTEDAQVLLGGLLQGLWNRLAQHQSSRQPFKLVREPLPRTREALGALTRMRAQEIAGFVDGLFGTSEQIQFPEKAHQAVQTIGELQGMLAGAAELLADDTKPAPAQELAALARNVQRLTTIAEENINKAIQSCKRARAQHLEAIAPTAMHRPDLRPDADEPPFVESPLSQRITRGGVTVQVEIYGDSAGKWILEVVDALGTSHVWDEHFETDEQALEEAIAALEEDPVEFAGHPESARDVH